jgi:hypothetical protein
MVAWFMGTTCFFFPLQETKPIPAAAATHPITYRHFMDGPDYPDKAAGVDPRGSTGERFHGNLTQGFRAGPASWIDESH